MVGEDGEGLFAFLLYDFDNFMSEFHSGNMNPQNYYVGGTMGTVSIV